MGKLCSIPIGTDLSPPSYMAILSGAQDSIQHTHHTIALFPASWSCIPSDPFGQTQEMMTESMDTTSFGPAQRPHLPRPPRPCVTPFDTKLQKPHHPPHRFLWMVIDAYFLWIAPGQILHAIKVSTFLLLRSSRSTVLDPNHSLSPTRNTKGTI
jgi:hypothetical protein